MSTGSQVTSNKDLRRLFRKLSDQGWEIVLRRAGHIKLIAPHGGCYFTGASPSDFRAIKKLTADLRRMGADL